MIEKTHLPLDVKRHFQPVISRQSIKAILKRLPLVAYLRKKLSLNIWCVSGMLKNTNESLNLVYWGRRNNKNYLTRVAFDQHRELKMGLQFAGRLLIDFLKQRSLNMIYVIETRRIPQRTCYRSKSFAIPIWIGGYIDLSKDLERQDALSATAKNNIRKIRKHNFTYEVAKEPERFNLFYHRMYRQYAAKRYGDTAIIMPYDHVKQELSKGGELLMVRTGGKFVAGVLIRFDQETGYPCLSKLGVLDANPGYVKQGAISALYYYSILYLKKRGFSKVALGGTRPFLNDGVLQYKTRNWKMIVQAHPDTVLRLKPIGRGRGVKTFLLNNPFISVNGKEACGVVFLDQEEYQNSSTIEKLNRKYGYNGLSRLLIRAV